MNDRLGLEVQARSANLVGDFNRWDETGHTLKRRKDGSFLLTILLKSGKTYRYRFLLDGKRWENDWEAEA